MMMNPILETDSYNATHWEIRQNNEKQVAYMYNRNKPIIFFGLAGLVNTIFKTQVKDEHIAEAAKILPLNNIKFNLTMWEKLVVGYKGDISKVLKIEQLPEFYWYPKGTPLAKISNLDPDFVDLVTYFEGYLTKCYYTSEVMTRLYEMKRAGLINIHNFGYRGYRCEAEALLADCCFSMMYDGTDSLHVNLIKEKNFTFFEPYKKIIESYVNPTTITAASHAVVQSYEFDIVAYRTMIRAMSARSLAFPIDTFGEKKFIDNYLDSCLENACRYNTNLFFRIDSGDHLFQAKLLLLKIIGFRQTHALVNYQTLPKMGIIIGDNMNLKSINKIMKILGEFISKKYDVRLDNYIYFGVGGKLTEGISRDLVGMVIKLGYADRPTMKTTNGKSSLLGGELNVKMERGKYTVVSGDNGMYNLPAVNMVSFETMKLGRAFGHGNKLILSKPLKEQINSFRESKLRIV